MYNNCLYISSLLFNYIILILSHSHSLYSLLLASSLVCLLTHIHTHTLYVIVTMLSIIIIITMSVCLFVCLFVRSLGSFGPVGLSSQTRCHSKIRNQKIFKYIYWRFFTGRSVVCCETIKQQRHIVHLSYLNISQYILTIYW